jgi:hypothetical protein
MPRLILISDTTTCDYLVAFDTARSKLFLIAGGTVDFLLAGDEALGAYGSFAYTATETFLMPLTCLVLHLLRAGSEDLAASIAAGGKLGIVAIATVDLVCLRTELFVHE